MPDRDAQPRESRHVRRHRSRHDPSEFLGLDVERMSPEARVAVAAVVIVPIVVAATLILLLASQMSWLIFVFGWAIFPAFGLLIRGIVGVLDDDRQAPSENGKERELLGALRRRGELTPATAAMETTLTVAEADGMLKSLAEGGHLEVRVKGGSLSYALWEGAALGPGEKA